MAGNMVCFLVCQSKEGVEIYRDALKGGPIFLSNSWAGPGRWWIPVLCRVAECYPPSSTLGHWPRKKIRFLSASSLPPFGAVKMSAIQSPLLRSKVAAASSSHLVSQSTLARSSLSSAAAVTCWENFGHILRIFGLHRWDAINL